MLCRAPRRVGPVRRVAGAEDEACGHDDRDGIEDSRLEKRVAGIVRVVERGNGPTYGILARHEVLHLRLAAAHVGGPGADAVALIDLARHRVAVAKPRVVGRTKARHAYAAPKDVCFIDSRPNARPRSAA